MLDSFHNSSLSEQLMHFSCCFTDQAYDVHSPGARSLQKSNFNIFHKIINKRINKLCIVVEMLAQGTNRSRALHER